MPSAKKKSEKEEAQPQEESVDSMIDDIAATLGITDDEPIGFEAPGAEEQEPDPEPEPAPDEEGEGEEEESEKEEEEEEKEEEEPEDGYEEDVEPEGEGEEGEEGEDEEQEFDFRSVLLEDAKKKLEKESGKKEGKKDEEGAKEEPKVEKKEEEVKPPPPPKSPISITKEQYHAILENEEGINEHVINPIVDRIEQRISDLIKAIPIVMSNIAGNVVNSRLAVSDFYAVNQDLIPYKALVEVTTNEISAEKPELGYDELMENVGKEVRRKLNMPNSGGNGGTPQPRQSVRKPANIRPKQKRTPQPPRPVGMQAEIDDLLTR